MKPYYEDGQAKIYCADSLELVKTFESDKIAVVSDPPFGMAADFERRGLRKKSTLGGYGHQYHEWKDIAGDDKPFDPSHLLRFPIVALFGANHYADKLPPEKVGKQWKWLFWDKRNGSGSDDNSDGELIWTNQSGALRVHSQKWRGMVREGEENLAKQGIKLHPAQKPVSLMRWIIGELKIPQSFTIYDPYMGSGSSLVAAKQLGYKIIGCDLNPLHCKTTVSRLAQGAFIFASA